jgi:hypothetical protein
MRAAAMKLQMPKLDNGGRNPELGRYLDNTKLQSWFKKQPFRVTPGASWSTKVVVTMCWSIFDHHLGLVHNSWRCCNLQWRADQGDGLARSYPCFMAVFRKETVLAT